MDVREQKNPAVRLCHPHKPIQYAGTRTELPQITPVRPPAGAVDIAIEKGGKIHADTSFRAYER
jgi:hypothetical protein